MSNKDCSIGAESNKVLRALRRIIPSYNTFANYKVSVWENGDFSEKFKSWHKEKYGKEPSSSTTRPDVTAKRIIEWYNSTVPSVHANAETKFIDQKVVSYGYTDTNSREFAIRTAGTMLLEVWNELNTRPVVLGGNKAVYYSNQLMAKVKDLVLARAAELNETTVEEETERIIREGLSSIYNRLGGDEMTDFDKNLYAFYREVYSGEQHLKEFMKEVLFDNRLGSIYGDIGNEFKDDDERKAQTQQDAETVEDPDGETTEELSLYEVDDSILKYNSHDGQYKTFTMHISERVKNYFNTLRKLNSFNEKDGSFVENRDTALGIADTMDSSACSSMMFNRAYFRNIEEMIEEVKKIGRTVPGFEAFSKFAYDLENDIDFATEVCSIFLKAKMSALEVRKEGDTVKSTISNTKVTPRSALLYDLAADYKGTALNVDTGYIDNVITEALSEIGFYADVRGNGELAAQSYAVAVRTLKDVLRSYFPTIDEKAIDTFIELNSSNNLETVDYKKKARNIKILFDELKKLNDNTKFVVVSTEEIRRAQANEFKKPADERNFGAIYAKDVLDNDLHWQYIGNITNYVLPYSVVSTDLNSRNIKGNNQSQVMNVNLITQIDKMLTDVQIDENGNKTYPTLIKWGQERVNVPQFKYNALLFPQYDENGKVLNPDYMFDIVNGQVVCKKNPLTVLRLHKHIGSANMDNGENSTYSDMTSPSYGPTSYIQYFNGIPANDYAVGRVSHMGTFFLRTPSDAPQAYTASMGKINTAGLTVFNEEGSNEVPRTMLRSFMLPLDKASKYIKFNTEGNVSIPETSTNLKLKDFINAFFNRGSIYINKNTKGYTDEATGETYYVVSLGAPTNKDDGADRVYKNAYSLHMIVKGDAVSYGGNGYLDNYEVVGLYQFMGKDMIVGNDTRQTKKDYSEEVRLFVNNVYEEYNRQLEKNDVILNGTTYKKKQFEVNREHAVVKLMLNQFKQELLDAAVALNYYFETTPDGKVVRVRDINSKDFGRVVEKNDTTKGFANYHKKGNSVIETKRDSRGRVVSQKLTGNVFRSGKFNMFFNGASRNYMDGMFSESTVEDTDKGVINLLYGGADTYLRTIKDDDGKVIDIQLTPAQEAKAIDCIVDFIKDYIDKEYNFFGQFEDIINSDIRTLLNHNNITDYAINNFFAFCNYDGLFEGDTKFYKGAQDLFKRSKESQGSGVPLGLADYTQTDGDGRRPIENSFVRDGIVYELDRDGNRKSVKVSDFLQTGLLKGFEMRTTFRGVTIKNTQKTHENTLKRLTKSLVEESGISEEAALDILYGPANEKGERTGGFQNTKVNDAQSYITFDEWVRRIIMKGQFRKYYPLIKKLNDPNGDLDDKVVSEFMQVQKNFYFDNHYNKKYGIFAARQIKNAELVLHPRLVRGTELEHVYNAMKKAGIDQLNTVETSKASNEEVLTLWDNDGNLTQEALDNFIKDAPEASDDYYYNNLYVQLETKQHVNAENKAGIQLIKKIIDNIANEGHPLSPYKQRFVKNFIQNIKSSFKEICDKYEIPIDKDGNFIIDAETGKIGQLNQSVVFDRVAEELMRKGVNSNMLDYVTMEDGSPIMPIVMSNTITTLENVFQSMFNSAVTSQKLPGLHGVQVTNVGWKKLTTDKPSYISNLDNYTKITQEQYDKLSDEEKKDYHDARVSYASDLRYHPEVDGKVQHYIEVKVPLSHFGIQRNHQRFINNDGYRMRDEEIDALILKELEEQGLDKFIGYRIPTEGKQSMAVMKIVGFVPDDLGSSIVVPDDWVSQTGSDFDVDSVYCVGFNSYVTAAKIHRVGYIGVDKNWNEAPRTIYDYVSYLRTNKVKADIKSKEAKENLSKETKDDFNELYENLINDQRDAWAACEEWESDMDEEDQVLPEIKEAHAKYDGESKGYSKQKIATDKLAMVLSIVDNYIDVKTKLFKDGGLDLTQEEFDELIEPYINLKDATKDVIDYINNRREDFRAELQHRINDFYKDKIASLNEKAKKRNLLTYEEFMEAPVEEINSKEARDNAITQAMIDILSDPTALEENLSRSNFDDIIDSRNRIMNPIVSAERNGRSPYIVSDQIMYQEDAMSGYALKGMSVALDSMCSVCNQAKATLSDTYQIQVIYDAKTVDVEKLKKSFGEENVDEVKRGKTVVGYKVTHNKYGWTNDNYNVSGKILTSYSSQTTAHILDAVKEGAIPNVNTYTFTTYKTLVQIGSNYDCAVGFIMQPGIKRIVQAFNNSNSVFYDGYKRNPIDEALQSIAKDLGITVKNTATARSIVKKIAENKEFVKEFKKLFGKDADIKVYSGTKESLPLDIKKMVDRIKENGSFAKANDQTKTLFDLGMILAFDKIHYTAENVSSTARCLNPDKFGAKQTVYETRQVFDNIHRLIQDGTALRVGDESILSAIYPGVNKGLDNFLAENRINESSHPIMYAFLRYATAPSIKIAEQVIPTERKGFYDTVMGITRALDEKATKRLSNEEYKDVKMYILKSIYDRANGIVLPISVTMRNGKPEIVFNNSMSNMERDILIHNEAMRIYGLDRASGFRYYKDGKLTEFTVKDLNNPTQDELEAYAQLSPAQKVLFIKTKFRELGIFRYLKPNTSIANGRTWRSGLQTIEYVENQINENTAFSLFKEAFYSKNMLVKLAAFDVIKYGVVFEGLRMRSTAINKIIDNLPLRESFGNNGTGLVDAINDTFDKIHDVNEAFDAEHTTDIYERYLRSHPKSKLVKTLNLTKAKREQLGFHSRSGYMLAVIPPRGKDGNLDIDKFMDNLITAGIYSQPRYGAKPVRNNYIRIKDGKKGVHLYKVIGGKDGILLYPFNNLMEQETTEISINPQNMEFPTKYTYERLIKLLLNDNQKTDFSYADAFSATNISMTAEGNGIDLTRPTRDKIVKDKTIPNFNELADQGSAKAIALRDQIFKTIERPINADGDIAGFGYVVSSLLADYKISVSDGITQKFTQGANNVNVLIKRVSMSKYVKDYVIGDKSLDNITDPTVRRRLEIAKEAYKRFNNPNITIKDVFHVEIVVDDSYAKAIEQTRPEDLNASLEEVNYNVMEFAQRRSEHGEKEAIDFIENVRQQNIAINKQGIKDNAEYVIAEAAKYFKLAVREVVKDFNTFTKVPGAENEYYKITDKEVQELLKNNAALQSKYMGLLNRIDALKKKISLYRDFKITTDASSEEDKLGLMKFKSYIDSIEASADDLFKLDTNAADEALMEGWLKSQSTNPLIYSGMMSLRENYHKTYGDMWKFHDIMESGNSMVQVILTNVMNDMESRRMAGERAARAFRTHMDDIEKRARAAGVTIDKKKFINDDGTFVQDFVQDLITDFNKKAKAVQEAARVNGYGSVEHLRAKYDLDLFKYLYLEQEAKDDYYKVKLNFDRMMLTGHPEIFSAYQTLNYRLMNLYKNDDSVGLTPEQLDELETIRYERYKLTHDEKYRDKYGEKAVTALKIYKEEIAKLNEDTFENTPEETFESQLEMYLGIIERAENPDKNGVPQTDELVLANDQVYQSALAWIKHNARRGWKEGNDDAKSFKRKLSKMLAILSTNEDGTLKRSSSIIKSATSLKSILDKEGIPDGRKVSAADIKAIKATKEAIYAVNQSTPYSDTRLIGYKPPVRYIFKGKFYEGMKPNGVKSHEFTEISKKINAILCKYIDHTGNLNLQQMGNDPLRWEEERADLHALAQLYRQLRGTKRTEGSTNGEAVKEYIKNNVKFETNNVAFGENKVLYNAITDMDFRADWLAVHCDMNEDGEFLDANGEVTTAISGNIQPNRYLYGYAMPKAQEGTPEFDALVDKDKTDAVTFLDKYFVKTPTKYYSLAAAEVRRKADEAKDEGIYKKWWQDNHVYNPYTHRFELIDVWVNSHINAKAVEDYGDIYGWIPKGPQVSRSVKADHANEKYNKEKGLFGNYKKGAQNGKYDSKVTLNNYETEMRDYMMDTLMSYASTRDAKKFFRKGNLPIRAKEKEMSKADWLMEASKFFGFNMSNNTGERTYYDDVEYTSDSVPAMPMTRKLVDPKRTVKFNTPKPKTTDEKYNEGGKFNETLYANDLAEWQEAKEKIDADNEKIHQDMLDRDWIDVVEDFIYKASHYNAINTNKDKVFYLLNFLESQQAYIRKYGLTGDLKRDTRNKAEDEQPYATTTDEDLIKQLKNQINRLFYDQWKKAEGKTVAFANNLQGFTSANYMMLNIRGGIANITVGATGMLAETLAGEYAGKADAAFATRYWSENVVSFIYGMYKKTSTTKADAMIKYFKVVDYDEITGTVRTFSPKTASERLRDLMFSPQAIGEHFMQNSMMFAMSRSHKIVRNPYNGEYTHMNLEEYIRVRESIDLDSILTPEQREAFKKEMERIKSDANVKKDFAWFRKDIITEFISFHLDKTQRDVFLNKRKENQKKYKDEFDKLESIFDQIELGKDGYMSFKEGSLLASLADKDNPENVNFDDNGGVTAADKILASFGERVKHVNNKVHGVYNKLGAAYIERTWYGSLIMQYHKHLPFGLLKRYRTRGYFNESRGAVEKGMYTSLSDFLNFNFRRMCHENQIDTDQLNTLQSVQTLFAHILQYCGQISESWHLIPEYERANIRRNLGGLIGTLAAIATVVGLLAMGAGGDDDDRLLSNLMLYEADRLASEAFLYTPVGMLSETKKLMSTPLAAQSIVNDVFKTMTEISSVILYGEDSSVYKTGRFAGQSKYAVFIKRRIPAYAGINSLLNTPENNHYFKMGKTALSIFPTEAMAESIRTTFE